ncbi:ABC transporter permease [Candidatus Woesearchaeota archaeon]|nr:ABC transporter permease [Candidatus Woesearchaeota archaeon]
MTTNWIAFWTLTRKEVNRVIRIWTQTLVPSIFTSSLFILIFGYSLGSKISNINGVTYLEFILPGLVMMGVIMSAYTATSFSLYLQRFHRGIEELLLAPMSYWEIIGGLTLGALVRALIVGFGIIIVGLFLTPIGIFDVWIITFFAIVTSLLFAFAGIVTALWANNFDQMNVFSTFLITPLTYLGGIFYSINMLPQPWNIIAAFNPIMYMVDGFRYGFLGFSDVPLVHSILVVSGLAIFFFLLCIHLFRKGYNLRS